jgi:hypothetical protein
MSPFDRLFTFCYYCDEELLPHPLFDITVAKHCLKHGDYFIQQLRGKEPVLIFTGFAGTHGEQKVIARVKKPISNPPLAQRVSWSVSPADFLAAINPDRPRNKAGNPGVKIKCNETGDVFSSIREACRLMNLDHQSMWKHFRGERKTVKKYTFSRLDE